MYLFFKTNLDKKKKGSFLHFAPEKSITELVRSYKNIRYMSVDKEPRFADKVEDITNLSFEDNSFDIIYCSHVLEHIQNDHQAMLELRRVLKKQGYAIIQVPIADQETTYENPHIVTEADRVIHFGQKDHVRVYGRDYVDRLRRSGFTVNEIDFVSTLPAKQVEKYSLIPHHKQPAPTEGIVYVCRK